MRGRSVSHRSLLGERRDLDDNTPSTMSLLSPHNLSVVSRATVNLSSLNRQLSVRSNREAGMRMVVEQCVHHTMATNKVLKVLIENFFPEYLDLTEGIECEDSTGTDIKLVTSLQTTTMSLLKTLFVSLLNNYEQQEEIAEAISKLSPMEEEALEDDSPETYSELEASISELTSIMTRLKALKRETTVDLNSTLSSENPLFEPNDLSEEGERSAPGEESE